MGRAKEMFTTESTMISYTNIDDTILRPRTVLSFLKTSVHGAGEGDVHGRYDQERRYGARQCRDGFQCVRRLYALQGMTGDDRGREGKGGGEGGGGGGGGGGSGDPPLSFTRVRVLQW